MNMEDYQKQRPSHCEVHIYARHSPLLVLLLFVPLTLAALTLRVTITITATAAAAAAAAITRGIAGVLGQVYIISPSGQLWSFCLHTM